MDYEIIQIGSDSWRIEDSGVRFFLLAGTERALLVDSGRSVHNARNIAGSLTDLPIGLLNTHGDMDHVGSNAQFDAFYMHPDEEENFHPSARPHAREHRPAGPIPTGPHQRRPHPGRADLHVRPLPEYGEVYPKPGASPDLAGPLRCHLALPRVHSGFPGADRQAARRRHPGAGGKREGPADGGTRKQHPAMWVLPFSCAIRECSHPTDKRRGLCAFSQSSSFVFCGKTWAEGQI